MSKNKMPLFTKNIAVPLFSFIAIASIFVLQPQITNFTKGHRGWVHSGLLALAENTTVENNFVGHICSYKENGTVRYGYFDRRPTLFPAITGLIVRAQDTLSQKIMAARYLMNTMFIITFFILFVFLNFYIKNKAKSLALCLFLGSGHCLMNYKDMLSEFAIAFLGFMLFAVCLILFEKKKIKLSLLIIVVMISCLLDFAGFVCFSILVWFIFNSYRLRRLFHSALALLVVAIFVHGGALFYNITVESTRNNVAWNETGIVESMLRRTIAKEKFNPSLTITASSSFKRFLKGVTPGFVGINALEVGVWLLLLCALVYYLLPHDGNFLRRELLKLNYGYIEAALFISPLIYTFLMKRVIYYHEFTAVYLLIVHAILAVPIFHLLPDKRSQPILVLSLCIFIGSLFSFKIQHEHVQASSINHIKDFESIRLTLDKIGTSEVNITELEERMGARGTPFAGCFYVGDRFGNEKSKYIISHEENNSLTPGNINFHLNYNP